MEAWEWVLAAILAAAFIVSIFVVAILLLLDMIRSSFKNRD